MNQETYTFNHLPMITQILRVAVSVSVIQEGFAGWSVI